MIIAVVGLGYVGFPLLCLLSNHFKIIGFDINERKIKAYNNGENLPQSPEFKYLKKENVIFTSNKEKLKEANIIIVAVPTPTNKFKIPDTTILKNATKLVGSILQKGQIVVFESTVYPTLTEEELVPILEKESNLKWKEDFFVAYSPERVNPGDENHTIDKIIKLVSADKKETLDKVSAIYSKITKVFKVSSIKVAEAAKVIENVQRDINIALMNELAMLFDKLNINTKEVLEAAGTKWNFLKFTPGLVGGHCIPEDPYYLLYKARQINFHPNLIAAGRKINDFIPYFCANKIAKLILQNKINNPSILILGATFKENVNDIRNSKVIELYKQLKEFNFNVEIFDPIAEKEEFFNTYKIKLLEKLDKSYDVVILAVKHKIFLEKEISFFKKLTKKIFIDLKQVFNKEDFNNLTFWQL